MLEGILLVNLMFSVVGFFFIFRMWKEVKSRRDYYGENFGIPKGRELEPMEPVEPEKKQAASEFTVEDMLKLLQAQGKLAEPEPEPEPEPVRESDDLNKLLAAALAAQKGGA